MESLYHFERILQSYQSIPKNYGTEDLLFMTEVHVIKEIGENPGMSLNELADKTYRTKSAMSVMVKGLSEKKLVNRKRDEEDNRRYMLSLTESGKKVYKYHKQLDFDNYIYCLNELESIMDLQVEDLQTAHKLLENINKIFYSRISS